MSRTVAIVQARMGSTRLPGKVLRPLLGEPLLARVVSRVERASCLDGVVVATTTEATDDPIVELAARSGWTVSRGSEMDVLDRYRVAAEAAGATTVVRITSDCPLIDPSLIDAVVKALDAAAADYASDSLEPRTYPRGLDVEAMRIEALQAAWEGDTDPASREHVTPFIYRSPGRFRLAAVRHDQDLSHHRWTVDTPEDLALVEAIYDAFGHDEFGWQEALEVVERHPEWSAWNAHVVQKAVPGR